MLRCRPCSGEPSARKPPSRPSARTCTHPHQRPPHHPPTWTGTTRRAPPASRSTTTPPSLALTPRSPPASSTNASAAASSFSPSPPPYPSAEDFKDSGFQTCYLLDFIGPKKFAFELARFVPRDERAKLNCVTNPHVFEQLLQLDVGDLLTREKSRVRGLLQAAGEFIQKPFRIQLGRGSYGECLAIRADGHTQLSHEIGLELSQRSAAAGLRPIGAVVFMQRGVLKVCLRTSDSTVNTSEIAKAYGGGGKQSSSSFTLRMDEFNIWTSVNS